MQSSKHTVSLTGWRKGGIFTSCLLLWFRCSGKVLPITLMSNNGLHNVTRCQWSFQYITELIRCFPFVNLGRSQMSLSKLGTEVNQIKWDWTYQSSCLFEGPCWLPEHMSSFIFSQFTWWINSPADCLAPILHLHKSNFRWNIQSSPLPQDSLHSLCCDWNNHLYWVLSRGYWKGVGRLYLTAHICIYWVPLIAYHRGMLKTINDKIWDTFLILLRVIRMIS